MKYYLHDSNSFNDEKVTELYINFGYEGLGLFYTILEKLAQQEKPIKTEVLKHQLKVGKKLNKVWCFMEQIDLISSNNGETFNKQLLNFSHKYQVKKEKNAKRISEWRNNQVDTENVTHYESVRNTPKVKLSKVKLNKDIIDYLNSYTGKNFKSTTDKTKALINARLNEGFKLEDFKKVIEVKSKEWVNSDNEKYLRPETLFGTKFEGYLNSDKSHSLNQDKNLPSHLQGMIY